jgi:hypothetical protein
MVCSIFCRTAGGRNWPITSFVPFCVWRLPVVADKRYLGGPRVRRGRALSRGQATARPSPQAVSAHSGYDRSAKNGNTRYARLQDANNQDWSRRHACMLHRGSHINLYPVELQWLYQNPAYCSSAPRWMGLVSRTTDKANPASSVTHPSRLWPGSVGHTHSTG